ncbi:MAG: long-chain fatty acid--CoA ligase [Deltaproteobacteria bacterium]|nr:long-chain fatty acid--CoA ligase [Deltaproteobacteria bacterium]
MEEKSWHQLYDFYVPTTIRYPRIPVQKLFHRSASVFADRTAINFFGTEMTYWQLREQVLRMAHALGRQGLKKGDRVGIQLPNCPQFVVAYLATISLGAIVVNVNPLYTSEELRHIITTTGMDTLFTFDMNLPVVRPLAKALGVKRVIVTSVKDYIKGQIVSTARSLDLEEGWLHFSKLIEECPTTTIPRITIDPEDPALIQFTGGTTGFPKGAVLTHGNIVAATLQALLWGGPPPERNLFVLGVLPLFHVYGNISVMNWGLVSGATQILLPTFTLDEVMDTIGKFPEISYFPAVPTMITAVMNHSRTGDLNLDRRIKLLNSGGAPMPAELIERVSEMGIAFGEGWGMSESTALGTANPLLAHRTGSIGIPMPDNEIRLVDPENGTEDVKPGEPGEIILRGPVVMQEYWNNPEETRDQLRDGWLFTGDIAQTDQDGYIYIVDRKKDMIIAGGFNIYPREIDEILYQHPKIKEAVAVGVPDAYRGETVKAFVVLKDGETAAERDIIDFCREKMTAYKVPKSVEFRKEIPKSAVGKILRKILRDEELKKRAEK